MKRRAECHSSIRILVMSEYNVFKLISKSVYILKNAF